MMKFGIFVDGRVVKNVSWGLEMVNLGKIRGEPWAKREVNDES